MKGCKLSEETKRKIGLANLGKKLSEETKKKLRLSHLGEKAYNWKGNNATKIANHHYIRRHYPHEGYCETCGTITNKLDLANIKNHVYTKDRNDYRYLCRSCHEKFDKHLVGDKHPMYGKHHTEQTKLKMRLANLGKKNKYNLGNKNHLGHKHTEETKQKMRLTKLSRKSKEREIIIT